VLIDKKQAMLLATVSARDVAAQNSIMRQGAPKIGILSGE
jgi:hypothetical protein